MFFSIALLLCGGATATAQQAEDGIAGDARMTAQLQALVDDLRERLGMDTPVTVALVERDPRVVSVRANRGARGAYEVAVERRFLDVLSAPQLEAALAHELGHVWIATHHPFLQTEQLANRVAMRVVAREHLVEVYQVLWGTAAVHGSLEAFLGLQVRGAATAP
jgi:hypothetical protein